MMENEYTTLERMPVDELLVYVDRSNPQVRALAERLQLFSKALDLQGELQETSDLLKPD